MASEFVIESGPVYIPFAEYHLNYFPGTMTPTPPDYKKRLAGNLMSYAAAHDKKREWMSAVGPGSGFTFGVELIDEHCKRWHRGDHI